jgi:hypothetical protein
MGVYLKLKPQTQTTLTERTWEYDEVLGAAQKKSNIIGCHFVWLQIFIITSGRLIF